MTSKAVKKQAVFVLLRREWIHPNLPSWAYWEDGTSFSINVESAGHEADEILQFLDGQHYVADLNGLFEFWSDKENCDWHVPYAIAQFHVVSVFDSRSKVEDYVISQSHNLEEGWKIVETQLF